MVMSRPLLLRPFIAGLAVVFGLSLSANAQEVWSLQRCIQHAQQHNLQMKLSELALQNARLTHELNQLSRWPSLSASAGGGVQFGRTIDPATNDFVSQRLWYNSYSINTGVTLYNGGFIRNNIRKSEIDIDASRADAEYTADLIALNVATAYLAVLQAEEQLDNARRRLELSQMQLDQTDKLIRAGSLPQTARYDIEAQVARDAQGLVQAEAAVESAYLTLKNLLNLDPEADIRVEHPQITIPADANPEAESFVAVYKQALNTQAHVRADELRLRSAGYSVALARAARLPRLSLFANVNTNWSSAALWSQGTIETIQEQELIIDGTPVTVGFPVEVPLLGKKPFKDQLFDNFGQGIGLQLSIPIFTNGQARIGIERAELGVEQARLQLEQTQQQLRNDVQRALADARAAHRNYEAALRSAEAARVAFDAAQKRYELGAINQYEYNTARNNLDIAEVQLTLAKYDYLFKLKVLDFYKGRRLTID